MNTIKTYLFPVLIAVMVGFGLGMKWSSMNEKASRYDSIADARVQDGRTVQQVLANEAKIQSDLEQVQNASTAAATKVSQTPLLGKDENVKVVYQTKWKTKVVECERDPHLSVGAVRLLNGSREGTTDYSSGISDEEGRSSSVTRLSTLVSSDIEVAKKYNDLAIRHNALVEYVNGLVTDQQKRLNP